MDACVGVEVGATLAFENKTKQKTFIKRGYQKLLKVADLCNK